MHSSFKREKSMPFMPSYLLGHILAFCCGLLVGFKILPATLVAIIYCIVSIACLKYALDNNLSKLFNTLPYIVYTEVYIRHAVMSIPYMFVTYLYILIFFLLLIRQKKWSTIAHSKIF